MENEYYFDCHFCDEESPESEMHEVIVESSETPSLPILGVHFSAYACRNCAKGLSVLLENKIATGEGV